MVAPNMGVAMMPARTEKIEGGRRAILFSCEICGAPASFGFGVVGIREALASKDVRKLGLWSCFAHREAVNRMVMPAAHTAPAQPQEEPDGHGSNGPGDLLEPRD